ncbi:hypothetical protein NIES267_53090 [Calothrix parasitica NIES-267]|uniref:Uncharacterized protein n=1 Tax=Calothrix parasitica NIES-267 TaxID=1973488 RepID=A0A1Z4LXJ5_9CYAN|nr:hypothetical protein NIES267_53090 [Calothrix parasitica NIES-267]
MHNTNPFPGRKIQLVYLADSNIKIIWKHPEDSTLERISKSIFLFFYLIFLNAILIYILGIPTNILIRWFTANPIQNLNLFGFIYQCFSIILMIAVFCFFLYILFYIISYPTLSLLMLIQGTGYSYILLNDKKIIYQEGQDPLFLNSRNKSLFEDKRQQYDEFETQEMFKFISNWKTIIFGKPTITFLKQEIQDIKIESVEKRLKLFIILNNQNIAIGKYLYNSEKQWLHQIINQWLQNHHKYEH